MAVLAAVVRHHPGVRGAEELRQAPFPALLHRLGDLAVKRLGGVRDVLSTRGVDMRHYPKLDWETVAAVNEGKLK